MAVLSDVIGTETFGGSAVSPKTYTGLTTGGSLTNGAVTFLVIYNTQVTGSAATWDGVACTLVASGNSTGTFGRVEVWGLSPIGTHTGNKTFSVSWTGGTSAVTFIQGQSWTGVNQTGGTTSFPGGNSATGTTGTTGTFTTQVNIVTNAGDTGIAGFCTDQNAFTSTTGTTLFKDFGANVNGAGEVGTGTGLTAFTGSGTATTTNLWAAVGANILAAAGATLNTGGTVFQPNVSFRKTLIYQALTQPVNFTTPTVIWNGWTRWPDSAPKAKPVVDFIPWRFIEPPPQVFFPFNRWADTVPSAKRTVEFPSLAFIGPQPTSGTATTGGTVFQSDITYTQETIYQAITQPVFFATPTITWNAWTQWPDFAPRAKPVADFVPWTFIEPAPQVFFPFDRWQDTAPGAKRSVEFPAVAFVAPQTPWTQWLQWPEIVPFRAKPTVDFKPWSFVPPPAQVFYPFDRWPDSALPFKRVAQNQDWAYGTFVTPTPAITWNAWTQWPDFLLRAKSVPDFIPWTFIEPAPQVWYPHDTWPDKVYGKPRAADFPFIALVVPTQPAPWTQWYQWPDFATRAKPAADFKPWSFVPPPAQVFFPYGPWDDFTRRKFVQVDTQPWTAPLVTTPPVITWNAWTQWLDTFPIRAKPVVDFMPWRFIEPPPQVWFPTADRWPDYLRKKPVPLNYDPLTLTQTVKTPWNTMTVWPDFAPIRGPKGLHPALQQFLARFPGTTVLGAVTVTISAVEVNSDGIIMAIQVFTSNPAARAIVSVQEIGMLSIVSIQEIGH